MQQGICQRRLLPEVRRLPQQSRQRMPGRQRGERDDEIADLIVGGRDPYAAAELLQHVDARPSVRRIHHQVHGAFRVEHVAQRREGRVGIGEMVQDAGAHDLVERHSQLADAIDRQLVDLEIRQVVLAFQIFSVADAGRAEVNPDDPSSRTARGMLRCLGCAAAGDEDGARFRVWLVRPEQVEVRAAPVAVLPAASIVVEVVGRPRIRIPFVEIPDRRRHVFAERAGSRARLPAVA